MTFAELDRLGEILVPVIIISFFIFLFYLRAKHPRMFFEGRFNPYALNNINRRLRDEHWERSMEEMKAKRKAIEDGTYKAPPRPPTPEERIEAKLDKLIKLLEEEK